MSSIPRTMGPGAQLRKVAPGPDYFAVQLVPYTDDKALLRLIQQGLNGRVFGGEWAVARE